MSAATRGRNASPETPDGTASVAARGMAATAAPGVVGVWAL